MKASHKQENDEQPESNLTIVNALNSDEDIDEENNEDFVKEEWKASKKKRKKNGKNSQEGWYTYCMYFIIILSITLHFVFFYQSLIDKGHIRTPCKVRA